MDPATLAAIGQGVSNVGGGLFGFFGQQQTNRTNLKLAEQSRQHDIEMWNRQNAYNTPQSQMQRFKDAGLNPNLIYGQGNSGNASPAPKAPVPEVSNSMAHLAQAANIPVLSMYQDFRLKNAQIDNIKAQAESTRTLSQLNTLKGITQEFVNKRHGITLPWLNVQEQYKTNISRYKSDRENLRLQYEGSQFPALLQQISMRNLLLDQQTRAMRLENDLNENLKPFGASSRDPLLQRLIMMYAPKILKPLINKTLPNYQSILKNR